MAKIKNRDKRKKAAQKKLNQSRSKEPPLAFDGRMQIPLDQTLLYTEVKERSNYTGDWSDKRGRILGKSRYYRITQHIFDREGYEGVATSYFWNRSGREGIAHAAQKAFDDLRGKRMDIDFELSYINVKA